METSLGDVRPLAGTEARFHRFQIGQIACTALSDGGIVVHRPAPPAPEGMPQNIAPAPLVVPLSCLVVQMPETKHTVLMDSGFGLAPELVAKPMQSAGRLLESLAAAGLTPASIDVVLISHFDIDHVAGLYEPDGSQVFPNATYYASREAIEFWSRKDLDLSTYPVLPWVKQERLVVSAHVLKTGGERIRTFHAGDEVIPGIKTMALPGHAPGQVGFILSSEGESLVYTADAITHAVVSVETPEVHNIMDLEPQIAVDTRKQLIDMLAEAGWHSFSPHFPFPGWGKVHKQGDKHLWKGGA